MGYNTVIGKIRRNVTDSSPLIHSITNPISINQCANAILAVGAKPIMAEHPLEAAEITQTAAALSLNLGNITDARMKSMLISLTKAKECGIPAVLDLVGIACSELRRDFVSELLNIHIPTAVKGNYSEIAALYNKSYKSGGVDADGTLDVKTLDYICKKLSSKLNTVILASGKTDIICGDSTLLHISNGTPQLSRVTGTGCMLGSLTACYLTAANGIDAAASACAVLGICGQLSHTEKGGGTFMVNLIDNLTTLTDENVEKYLNMEVKRLE